MAAAAYPPEFPCPSRISYGMTAYAGLVGTPMEAGNRRQRRTHTRLPHAIGLQWMMSQEVFGVWMPWVNNNGFNWFTIKLQSWLAGANGAHTFPHTIRITSDPVARLIQARGLDYWQIEVEAEWQPDVDAPLIFAPGAWVIAGFPGGTGLDWILPGPLSAPAFNVFIAGRPESPSALVIN